MLNMKHRLHPPCIQLNSFTKSTQTSKSDSKCRRWGHFIVGMLLVPRLVRNKLIPCYHQITLYMQIKCVELENKEFKFIIRKSWVWWIRMSRVWIVNVLQSPCVIVTALAHFNEIVITLIRKLKTCAVWFIGKNTWKAIQVQSCLKSIKLMRCQTKKPGP